jgi:hypothetical protein
MIPFLILVPGFSAEALEVNVGDGEITGAIDTRVSLGASFRMQDRDSRLIGKVNGGKATSVNIDNGNLNFNKGNTVSLATKVAHEVDLSWRNFGLFSRMYYFYDFANTDPDRTELSSVAKKRTVGQFRLLDLYATGDFEVGSTFLTIPGGQQVINWGESTFIPNGINGNVPFNVSQLRIAGAELREAFLPTPAIDLNLTLTDNLSVEGYYTIEWQQTFLEPEGTFFSTNDFASPGGNFALITGAGTLPDNPPLPGTFVSRASDRDARDSGAFGLAMRYFVPSLKDTEFGLYYQHFHSHLPIVSATRATTPGVAATANYFTEFPEDIDLVGASFNSEIGSTGFAIQGEFSYRFDQPLQVDDQELLVAGLNTCGVPLGGGVFTSQLDKNGAALFCGSPGEKVEGFKRKDVMQVQTTITKIWGAIFGADQMTIVGEGGATIVPNMESKSKLRYEGPGTNNSGSSSTAAAGFFPTSRQKNGFADDVSLGYRLLARMLFTNAIGPINLIPQVAWAHDIEETTPLPLGNFVENRKKITLSLRGTYQNSWEARVGYTNFFGAGRYNVRNDRDFISTVVSYAF